MNKYLEQHKRPVNLDLLTIKFPIAAIFSILHRISGVLIFISLPILLWGLSTIFQSDDSFQSWCFDHLEHPFLYSLLILILLLPLLFHTVSGVRHLVLDLGYGETKAGGRLSVWIATGVFILLALILLLIIIF